MKRHDARTAPLGEVTRANKIDSRCGSHSTNPHNRVIDLALSHSNAYQLSDSGRLPRSRSAAVTAIRRDLHAINPHSICIAARSPRSHRTCAAMAPRHARRYTACMFRRDDRSATPTETQPKHLPRTPLWPRNAPCPERNPRGSILSCHSHRFSLAVVLHSTILLCMHHKHSHSASRSWIHGRPARLPPRCAIGPAADTALAR